MAKKKKLTKAEYEKAWEDLGHLELKMVEQHGRCRHSVGETHYYRSPYMKPAGVCNALLHVLDLYTWRCALEFPSWEADDAQVFRVHCPSKNGTVWELRKRPGKI